MDDQPLPDGIVRLSCFAPAEEELAALRARLDKQLARGHHPRLLTPLPRRTRLRLRRDRCIDTAAAWLCAHHASSAAVSLWRLSGMRS